MCLCQSNIQTQVLTDIKPQIKGWKWQKHSQPFRCTHKKHTRAYVCAYTLRHESLMRWQLKSEPEAKDNKQSDHEYSCKLTLWFCVILSSPMNIPRDKWKRCSVYICKKDTVLSLKGDLLCNNKKITFIGALITVVATVCDYSQHLMITNMFYF